MRKPYLAGNWKMNLERRSGLELVRALAEAVGDRTDRDVAVAPPFVYLDEIARTLAGSPILVGAQNCCDEPKGAFTGEVSAAQLKDIGCDFVILGHSERRHVYGESDELVHAKVERALGEGLDVILCVGETIEERQAGQTEAVVARQLTAGLAGRSDDDFGRITIAYEPVWAIGTGHTATPEQAGAVHDYLRGVMAGLADEKHGASLPNPIRWQRQTRERRPAHGRSGHRRRLGGGRFVASRLVPPHHRTLLTRSGLMELLTTLLYILFVVAAIVLVVVILLQEGKGGGFGEALGSHGQETFGVGARGIQRFTAMVAGVFLVSAMLIHILNRQATGKSVIDGGGGDSVLDLGAGGAGAPAGGPGGIGAPAGGAPAGGAPDGQ